MTLRAVRPDLRIAWALAALTALAGFLRLWQIATLPPGYWYDEAHKSIVALEIARGLQAPIYVTDGQGIEAGYFWLLAAWFRLFGPSYHGTRILSALLGAATVPLTFWAARVVYRQHPRADLVGLVSAGGLAYLLWHVHWSRQGLETIAVPLFAVGLLGLLSWAWQARNTWAFALAGGVLGLSQYTNPGARALPLEALLVFGILAAGTPKRILLFGLVFATAALAAFAPLAWFYFNNPAWLFDRMAFASTDARAGGLPFYVGNVVRVLLAFNFWGDVMARHNLAGRPALDAAASFWMWAGAAAMFRDRMRWRAHAAVTAAFAVNLIPTIASDGAPGFGRMLGAAPMLMIVIGTGVAAAVDWIGSRPGQQAARLLIAASLGASAGVNVYDYFARYPRQPGMFDSFEVGLWTLTQSAVRAGAQGTGYLVLDEAGLQHPGTRLARELAAGDVRIVNGQTCFAFPAEAAETTIFATLPPWIPAILSQFPDAGIRDVLHEPDVYQYGAIAQVEAATPSTTAGVVGAATFGSILTLLSAELPGQTFGPGAEVPVTLRWRALATPDERYTTFVHLAGPGQPLVTGVDGEPCSGWYPTDRWRRDEVVAYTLALPLPPDLAPGEYEIAIGIYQWRTGERLPVNQAHQRESDRAFVGRLTVK